MTIEEVTKKLECEVITGSDWLNRELTYGFATDLLSDLLKIDKNKTLLITGLATLQTVRAAVAVDVSAILIVRGKKATAEMIELARENQIVLMEFQGTMFRACGLLYNSGLQPVY